MLKNITRIIELQEKYFEKRPINHDENDEFCHEFNPLHIYCRLIERGLEIKEVEKLVRDYENHFYIPLKNRNCRK